MQPQKHHLHHLSREPIYRPMGRKPLPEPSTRKSIALPDRLWNGINEVRKDMPGRVPSEAEVLRLLVSEALAARERRMVRGAKK